MQLRILFLLFYPGRRVVEKKMISLIYVETMFGCVFFRTIDETLKRLITHVSVINSRPLRRTSILPKATARHENVHVRRDKDPDKVQQNIVRE